MSRTIQMIFEQYRVQRLGFAQQCAEFSQRPENAEKMIQLGVVVLLRDLLTDTSASVQQSAALAVGRLASHSSKIADLLVKQDIIRIILYFNMDKSNKYVKRAALMAIRGVVRHNAQLARSVIDIGGLNQIVASLEDFDPGVKEAAAWVCGYIARHEINTAYSIIGAGAVPLLILCLQEPEVTVRAVAASTLSDVCKHSPETAQTVIDTGAIAHLVRAVSNINPNLKRQALNALATVAKHAMDMAEVIIEADVIQLVLEHCGHTDEHVRAAACALVRDIVKHSPDLAQLMTEAGGLGVLVNAVARNTGLNKLPGIMALGFIAGHNAALALSVVYSKGIDALNMAIEDATDGSVAAAAAWALGHIAQHSTEHAKHVSSSGILSKILLIYVSQSSSEDMKTKAKQALKQILLMTDDLESVEPLLGSSPPQILKYVVGIYSKILPKDPAARRAFVTSGGLRKLQELRYTDTPASASLKEHIALINKCFPEDIVNYFSPDYPQTLLDRVEQFRPTLNIDPTMWSERLFSDTKIPPYMQEEIQALQALLQQQGNTEPLAGERTPPPTPPPGPEGGDASLKKRLSSSKRGSGSGVAGKVPSPMALDGSGGGSKKNSLTPQGGDAKKLSIGSTDSKKAPVVPEGKKTSLTPSAPGEGKKGSIGASSVSK